MNPRIASIENLIATDPGQRDVFRIALADQLRLAAQSLRLARRVGIVSGFFVRTAEGGAGETDGPPGAKVLGSALTELGIAVDYITDRWNAELFRVLGLDPLVEPWGYLDDARPTHLLAIERLGRGFDGRYRNMRGTDVTEMTVPLDELFIEAGRRGLTTIGIGDGGNEIGMGKVFVDLLDTADRTLAPEGGAALASIVPTDFCIAAGVSNWGAYGLAGALSVLVGRDLLPSAAQAVGDVELLVRIGGAVDGVTLKRRATVDGLELSHSVRILEGIRRHVAELCWRIVRTGRKADHPVEPSRGMTVGVLGYGETGRAATALLIDRGHQVRVSDLRTVTVDRGIVLAGLETGRHSLEFFMGCDLVVASPGVREDSEIRDALHRAGIPVVSELELAYQFCEHELIAVTGTVGKRTTVELMQKLFHRAGRRLRIGGNRGRPLSALLLDAECAPRSADKRGPAGDTDQSAGSTGQTPTPDIALAVSSFQLESVVHFRPHVAVMLNVDEAHLDRHRTVAEYLRIKSRIFMNHRPDDVLILNFDDPRLRALARKHRGRTLFVSCRQEVDRGAWLSDGVVFLNVHDSIERIGPVNASFTENLLASIVTACLSGISPGEIAAALPELLVGSRER